MKRIDNRSRTATFSKLVNRHEYPEIRKYTFKGQNGLVEHSQATVKVLVSINEHEPSPLYGFIYPEEMYLQK